jgi:hypothetical protein
MIIYNTTQNEMMHNMTNTTHKIMFDVNDDDFNINCIDFYHKNIFDDMYKQYKIKIDQIAYNEHEKNFFHHFINLFDEKQFNKIVIDFLYIMNQFCEQHTKNDKNIFLQYVLFENDFYEYINKICFDNSCDVDDLFCCIDDHDDQCDILFNNILNN